MEHPQSQFESTVPYEFERIHAAAIYCSDGRFGEQCDDFLQNFLSLPRYDRLIVPGGPACLSDHYATYREGDMIFEELKFLVEAHKLTRVILIAHQDCAYYSEKLHIGKPHMKAKQAEDLNKAAMRIRATFPSLTIDAFIASHHDNRIHFTAVPLSQGPEHAKTHWT